MKIKVLLTVLFFICLSHEALSAEKTYGSLYVFKVHNVYDGDTFRVNIDSVHPLLGENISVRVYGIDCPELSGSSIAERAFAIIVRDYVRLQFKDAQWIVLANVRRDKYFRILADVYINGENLAQKLIDKGYAKPYDGGTKDGWDFE